MEDVLNKPIKTSRAAALPVIRQAFLDKKLQCFRPVTSSCRYRDAAGNPCAVGAIIPNGHYIIAKSNKGVGVGTLIANGDLDVVHEADRVWFRRIQEVHDCIVSLRVAGRKTEAESQEQFLGELLQAA